MGSIEDEGWSGEGFVEGFVDTDVVLRTGPWRRSVRREGYPLYHWMKKGFTRKMPKSLEGLCIQKSIDCIDDLRDVGQIQSRFLRIILPHCTAEQLLRVETETTDRDLTPITNKIWKKLFAAKFGAEFASRTNERMRNSNRKFRWRALYQIKVKEEIDMQRTSDSESEVTDIDACLPAPKR